MTDLCYYAYKQEVCDDDGSTHEETCVQGYWSRTNENKFFREVSYKICFSDCEPREVVEIVWHGKRVRYVGWQPGMKYQYVDDNNELVWEGYFPEWDH